MNHSRRKWLRNAALLGLGAKPSLYLRALVSGLPVTALAQSVIPSDSQLARDEANGLSRFMLMYMNATGDPINVNAPGSYEGNSDVIFHCPHPSMVAEPVTVGSTTVRAARPWASLSSDILNRSTFVHHRTYQNIHSQMSKVLSLVGSSTGPNGETSMSDHMPSIVAAGLAQQYNYVQPQPIRLGGSGYGYQGQPLPKLSPSILQSLLGSPQGGAELEALRQRELDSMYDLLKGQGASQRQKDWLDQFALSSTQLQSLDANVIQALKDLPNNSNMPIDAALLCFMMGLTPVASIDLAFGGDNHKETDVYDDEASELASGLESVSYIWQQAKALNLQDRLTVANINVFGRTLHKQGSPGRQHNGNHHVMMITGSKVNGGICGGIDESLPGKIGAGTFDSASGALTSGGDITIDKSLESVTKTLGVAAGATSDYMNLRVQGGKVISHALKV